MDPRSIYEPRPVQPEVDDPNYAVDRVVEYPATDTWPAERHVYYNIIDSKVRVEDLLYYRDKVIYGSGEMPDYIGWEMPDGKILQIYPDVKIIDKLDDFKLGETKRSLCLQTMANADGTKDYAPEVNKLPKNKRYKKADLPGAPPWYVWPLQPALLWVALGLLVFFFTWPTLWSLWAVSVVYEIAELVCDRIKFDRWWMYPFVVLFAPVQHLTRLAFWTLGIKL